MVSTKGKDLVEIIRELDDYFMKAANAGGELSMLLEVPICNFDRQSSSGDLEFYNLCNSCMIVKTLLLECLSDIEELNSFILMTVEFCFGSSKGLWIWEEFESAIMDLGIEQCEMECIREVLRGPNCK